MQSTNPRCDGCGADGDLYGRPCISIDVQGLGIVTYCSSECNLPARLNVRNRILCKKCKQGLRNEETDGSCAWCDWENRCDTDE